MYIVFFGVNNFSDLYLTLSYDYYEAVMRTFKSKAIISICFITWSAAVGWPVAGNCCPAGCTTVLLVSGCQTLHQCPGNTVAPAKYFVISADPKSVIFFHLNPFVGPNPELVLGFCGSSLF